MNLPHTLKFHRVRFGDTPATDIPAIGGTLADVKAFAMEALAGRYEHFRKERNGRSAPYGAALLNPEGEVVARFEVRPRVNAYGNQVAELRPEIWHGGLPS